jgi:DNA mismatch endonuclease (patch repair protein)
MIESEIRIALSDEGMKMSEKISAETRSRIMRAVKGAGTNTERAMRSALRRCPIRFREQAVELPGRPDFVNDRLRIAIFVDGDFWHGRWWCEHGEAPVANREYWIAKFERNRARDLTADRRLRRLGWSVLRIWESELLADPETVSLKLHERIKRCRRKVLRS